MNKLNKTGIIALTLLVMSLCVSSLGTASFDTNEPEVEEGLLFGFGVLMCVIWLVVFIVFIVLAIWVYKDAEKRGSSGALWLIIVIFTGIIGLIIWLVVRPPIGGKPQGPGQAGGTGRMCPNCGRQIPMDAQNCPYCGKNFGQ